MSEQKFKKAGEDDNDFDAGFKIPETKGVLGKLADVSKSILRETHEQIQDEEDKEDAKKGRPKKKKRQTGAICCCGSPSCRIGPFVETNGEEKDAE